MNGVNRVTILGNLGDDPKVRSTDSGVKVAHLRIATTESWRDRDSGEKRSQTEWHNVALWRGLAEVAEKYLHKGSRVYIEGKLQTRTYEDKDGVKRYSTEVVASEVNLLDKPQPQDERDLAKAAEQ